MVAKVVFSGLVYSLVVTTVLCDISTEQVELVENSKDSKYDLQSSETAAPCNIGYWLGSNVGYRPNHSNYPNRPNAFNGGTNYPLPNYWGNNNNFGGGYGFYPSYSYENDYGGYNGYGYNGGLGGYGNNGGYGGYGNNEGFGGFSWGNAQGHRTGYGVTGPNGYYSRNFYSNGLNNGNYRHSSSKK